MLAHISFVTLAFAATLARSTAVVPDLGPSGFHTSFSLPTSVPTSIPTSIPGLPTGTSPDIAPTGLCDIADGTLSCCVDAEPADYPLVAATLEALGIDPEELDPGKLLGNQCTNITGGLRVRDLNSCSGQGKIPLCCEEYAGELGINCITLEGGFGYGV